jgi:hypothetical protein
MRRSLGAGLALVLLVGGLVAPSNAAPREREETAPYAFDPTQGGFTAWFSNDMGFFFGEEVVFPTQKDETSVDITVTDDSGETMSAAVWHRDTTYVICGSAEDLAIRGGKPVYVQVFLELTPAMYEGCDAPALPTEGTVEATFEATGSEKYHRAKHEHH